MAYLGQSPITGKYSLCDNISSGFNGSTTSFGLTVNGDAVSPGTAANLLVSLGNVIKQPGTDYNVSGSSIVFTSAPANGTAFFATVLGDSYSVGIPSDNSVTPASLATSGDFTFPADIRLKDADGSNYVGFQSASTVASNIVWTLPSADGSSGQVLQTAGNGTLSWTTVDLTALNASNLTSGTVPDARFPATLPTASGINLTALNGSNISSGTIAAARVATLNQNTTGTSGGFTAGSASNLNAGTLPDARFPATLPAASGANLIKCFVRLAFGFLMVVDSSTAIITSWVTKNSSTNLHALTVANASTFTKNIFKVPSLGSVTIFLYSYNHFYL